MEGHPWVLARRGGNDRQGLRVHLAEGRSAQKPFDPSEGETETSENWRGGDQQDKNRKRPENNIASKSAEASARALPAGE